MQKLRRAVHMSHVKNNLGPQSLFDSLSRGYCTPSIDEMTKYLYHRNIDFQKCTDVASLTKLFNDTKANKRAVDFSPRIDSASTGVIQDPFPDMQRHGINPYHFVREVKVELCRKSRVDSRQMDLYLNDVLLDDDRRLCEYAPKGAFQLYLKSKR